ncbi:hypothetical protein [Actinoallomurus iriomotensis]|uniref:Uncharacterized protein n=1 Tax=Actinoallomurus iriomotensis TaxID=478107 RepID=A0A9W6RKZ5_9ACTN|nr:hypothetical protein [Actinoallomurus iriomotensis]GLY75942.1 hypothetical protein Airi01_042090 [Actinoallomurus iriomotensis]
MFWRKTREAIGRFHPAHQHLTLERTVTGSAGPGEWAAVLASLSQHETTVKRRKWQLPSRTTAVLVPLIHVLSEDTAPDGAIGVTADFRGLKEPGKKGPEQDLPVSGRVRRLTEWFVVDPWLQVRAELRDGSVLEIQVTDRVRHREIHRVNPRGKHKYKTKKKAVQRIDAKRTLARDAAVRRPGTPPPAWVQVRLKDGKRTALNATAKLPRVPEENDQLQAILTVVAELFRWTPPQTSGRTA